ncbi:regulatory protein RecX [Clostridium sp. CAG:678]|nr:regulatory protein RecX [Clostridium sp. CAG:678]
MIIQAQKGRGKKVHILLDGEYQITTDIDFWSEYGVADGTEISDQEWELLKNDMNYRKALNKGADLLSRRSHSVYELKSKIMRTCDPASAERAVEKFLELGYLNDEAFAAELAEHLFKVKNYSERNVRSELYKRGIDKEIINRVLSHNETDPLDSIIYIVNKRYFKKLSEDGGREKVIAALMRKGFSYSDIKTALNRIENEE